jgi:GDPmannose 4,6-dehydratase
MNKALIAGITGMAGSHLAEFLLSRGFEVHGIVRRVSTGSNMTNLGAILPKLSIHQADITDAISVMNVFKSVNPTHVYNLAGQSHIGTSWQCPGETIQVNAVGAFNIIEAARLISPEARIYTAITAEVFAATDGPQNESTPFHPTSPYACSKAFAYYQGVNYRERYGMHISNAFLFNHTSERRPDSFLSRKITKAAVAILREEQEYLELGNIDTMIDMGYAPDFVEAMYLMTEADEPDDYCIGTGETHSIREFLDITFKGWGFDWESNNLVRINPKFYRPLPPTTSRADITKITTKLGWKPKTSFKDMVYQLNSYEYDLPRW